jgi:glucosamine--fructose-6-phosphate aminotransferase (isomerizing)
MSTNTSQPDLEHLLHEIAEQPSVVARVLQAQREPMRALADLIRRRRPRALVLVARGSSDNAAVYGRYLFEICNRQLTALAAPSGMTLYDSGPRLDETVVIGISQSGQGEDVVAYVRAAREQGATTVAIVNNETSPLASTAEWTLGCLAGPELSVPATKTVTSQMTLLAQLSAALGGADAVGGLEELPHALERALGQREAAARLARQLADSSAGSVIGRGFAFPPALEIALKLKETSYTRAEPFSAADFFHGPVALVESGYSAIVLDCGGRSTWPASDTAREVQRRGGQATLLQAGEISPVPDSLALQAPIPEPYAPIVLLILGQLLAVELATARGLDPARPRGLRKVTSTR